MVGILPKVDISSQIINSTFFSWIFSSSFLFYFAALKFIIIIPHSYYYYYPTLPYHNYTHFTHTHTHTHSQQDHVNPVAPPSSVSDLHEL
jgi:hypothetical protein